MSDLDLELFPKRVSDQLLDKTLEVVREINPTLARHFDDVFDDDVDK